MERENSGTKIAFTRRGLSLLATTTMAEPGQKRKRGAEYAGALAALNKRQVSVTSRAAINRLPAGLLANTHSPGAYLHFISLVHK